MFITVIIFLILLSILVFVHEAGHFWTARRLGVRCEEFGFGFPPRLAGIYKTNDNRWRWVWGAREVDDARETIYSINWLPLGGFVKIRGEQGDHKNESDSFSHQSIWKRVVILSAGVFMNFVIAAVFLSVGFMIGLPQILDGVDTQNVSINNRHLQIIQVLPDSTAESAGVIMGDVVESIDGVQFANVADLQSYIADKAGQTLDYKILRGADTINLSVPLEIRAETNSAGIGVAIAETGLVSYSWYQAIWEGVKSTVAMTWYIIVAFASLLKGIFLGQGVGVDLSGPVGIAVMTGQAAQLGLVYLLQFAAVLSINLAIINYLPFPALDGGRVLFLIIEKIRGRAIPEKVEAIIHNSGFLLLMVLVLFVTLRDVWRFSDGLRMLWEKIF